MRDILDELADKSICLSRKIWSGVKFGPPGPKYAITAGPPLSQMVRHCVCGLELTLNSTALQMMNILM